MNQSPKPNPNPSPSPKNQHKVLGAKGERRAAAFLVERRCQVMAQNLKIAGGEIDILARDEAGTLLVVEVKTRASGTFVRPQVNITAAKIRTLSRLAHAVSDRYPESNVRVDVVEYDLATDQINYIKDIIN